MAVMLPRRRSGGLIESPAARAEWPREMASVYRIFLVDMRARWCRPVARARRPGSAPSRSSSVHVEKDLVEDRSATVLVEAAEGAELLVIVSHGVRGY